MLKKLKYFLKNQKLKKRENTFGPHTKGVIYDSENGLLAMPYEDMMIGKHLGFKGSWNMQEIEFLKKNIKKEDTIYIIGTHVGTLLVPIAEHSKQIIGYEANPDTFWFLQKNILLNDLNNTRVFNYAVGDGERKITFLKSKINTGGSKIKPVINDFKYKFDNPEEIEIDMVSLDEHIASNQLPSPDGILVDIEGAEFIALQGMPESLKKSRFLYIEYVPHHLKNVSGVSNSELVALIEPYFDRVISTKTKKEFDITGSSENLIDFLNGLDASEKSDDLIFLKDLS